MANAPPKSRYGWSASGELLTEDKSKTVSLQASFEQSGTYTVTFWINYLDPPDPLDPPVLAKATLEWAVSGNTSQRVVDVSNGASIQGVADYVRVVVTDASPPGPRVRRYVVNVLVARGHRAAYETPPVLRNPTPSGIGTVTVGPGASVVVPVPQNAGVRSVLVLVADLSGGAAASVPVLDQQARVTHSANGVTLLAAYDARQVSWVPLAAGATEIRLGNTSAHDLVYSVFFGIEG